MPQNTMTSPSAAAPSSAQPWTQHWGQTLKGSIDLQASDPVAQALRGWWQQRLPRLRACPDIVDVGSGPAVLARLMLSLGWALEPPVRWWCVDQAQLGMGWRHALPSAVRVLDETRFEASSAPEGPADALVSNFGLEYLPAQAAAQALPRWLKPQGSFFAVVHARGSVIDHVSREHADDLRLAMVDVGLHQRAKDLAQAMATAPRDPTLRMMHGVEVRDAYNQAVDRLKQHMEMRGRASAVLVDMLQSVTAVLRQVPQLGAAAACEQIAEQAQAYGAEAARLQQMQDSALDEAQARALQDSVAAAHPHGGAIELGQLSCSLGPVAWNLSSAP
jgi:hypothetical protein